MKNKTKPNSADNKHLIKLLNKKPIRFEENEFGVKTLAVIDEKKIKGEKSLCSRLSPVKQVGNASNLLQITFSHLFRMMYLFKELKNGQTILDIGCGESETREFLYRNFLHTNYVGVEIAEGALVEAQKKKSKGSFLYVKSDINGGLHFKSKSFDFIIFLEVIEHIEENRAKELMLEIKRVLKPGGKVYISTPDDEFASDLHKGTHVRQYTNDEMISIIKKSGFKLIETQGTGIRSKDLKKVISESHSELYEKLKGFFSTKILNAIFSYLYPEKSHAKAWLIQKPLLKKKRRKK